MKFLKPNRIVQFALLLLLSFQSTANINEATWYISIDVDKIESNEIFKIFEEKIDNSSDNFTTKFQKIPSEISYISLYGNAKGAENATAIIQGDFSQFSVNEYILSFLYEQEDVSDLVKESKIKFKNQEIQVLKISEYDGQSGKGQKEAYFAKVNNGLSVISFQLDEVKNWLNHNYDNHEIIKGNLFSVVVDVQSALAHMGMNIDKKDLMFQSEIFQKVIQASASISEENSDMVVELALSTADETTAKQIEQIINGLIAMSNLSGATGDNELQASLIRNLTIETNGNDIFINSYASIEDIKKMALQQNINSNKDGFKSEIKVKL